MTHTLSAQAVSHPPAAIEVGVAILLSDGWVTHEALYDALPVYAPRTVRHHTKRLVDAGLVETAWLFPENLYRWRGDADPSQEADFLRFAELMRDKLGRHQ